MTIPSLGFIRTGDYMTNVGSFLHYSTPGCQQEMMSILIGYSFQHIIF